MLLKVILIATLLMALAFAGIAIKMFFRKGAEFRKSCSSVDPSTGKRLGCTCGGEGESAGTCENRTA